LKFTNYHTTSANTFAYRQIFRFRLGFEKTKSLALEKIILHLFSASALAGGVMPGTTFR
jgi:hypothetical protein